MEIHSPAGLGFCRGRLSLDDFLLGGGILLRQQGLIALGCITPNVPNSGKWGLALAWDFSTWEPMWDATIRQVIGGVWQETLHLQFSVPGTPLEADSPSRLGFGLGHLPLGYFLKAL